MHLLPSTTTYLFRINMPKSKTKSRPAQPDTLRAASPAVATRTRLALVGTDTPLADREEADDQAAANATPKEADNAMAGVEPPTQPRNPDSEESEDEYSTDSSLNEDAVAADAEASRRRTSARLEELEGAQQDAPFVQAASQFAARGVRMLGRNAMPTADPFSTRSAGVNLMSAGDNDNPSAIPPRVGIAARMPLGDAFGPHNWTEANGYGRRPFPAAAPAPAGADAETGSRPTRDSARRSIDSQMRRGFAIPGLADKEYADRKYATVVRLRLAFFGSHNPVALIAHELVTNVQLMPYQLDEAFVKAFSRLEWKADVFGLDALHAIVNTNPQDGGTAADAIDLASDVCDSYADMQAAAHFGAQLLTIISAHWGERYVRFVLDLVRDPVFQSLGPGGVRAAVRLVDDQLRVLISSANAWASYVADSPAGTDLDLAPSAPDGILSATSSYTKSMVNLSLLRSVTGSGAAASPTRGSKASASTGPRMRNGKAKCPDFAFLGSCPRGDGCPMAHEPLSDAEKQRWGISFRRRPHNGRTGAGGKQKRRPGSD